MWTIAFVAFMAFLIKFSEERWWLAWFTIMGLLVQCGYKFSVVGLAVSMGASKVLKDIFQAR